MKKNLTLLLLLPVIAFLSCNPKEEKKNPEENGKDDKEIIDKGVMPAWSEGYLDIHFISAGRGECTFYILPDGTTMVVDAGEVFTDDPTAQPRKPGNLPFSYQTFGTYIKHFLPAASEGKIDYALITHFHIDHNGEMNEANAVHPQGGYQLTGASGLCEEVPFRKVIDRIWPDYDAVETEVKGKEGLVNWQKFMDFGVSQKRFEAERFIVGSDNQFRLLGKTKDSYQGKFRIFNIVGGGAAYRKGTDGAGYVDENTPKTENGASCGFHLQYGKFDYIAAGDLVSTAQNLMAYYNRDYIDKLEAFKANHHMAGNSWGGQMQKQAFCPRVIVVQSFDGKKPDPAVLKSVISGVFEQATNTWDKDVYLTKSWDAVMEENKDIFNQCAGYGGHVVIRVSPGGGSFRVYMLKDTDFSFEIKSVSPEYVCR